ncbi:MAG TPA: AAA family ATPase [Chthonomonadales bacterium]|nr:AAA family ATPase [Chthonomonadales bacterium]
MPSEYAKHFGLTETPFARCQNPRWLYLSAQHKETILKTRWAIEEHAGLVLWRADVGMGKSSLIEYLMTVWPKQFGWHCAKLQNTGSIGGPRALIGEVLSAFGIRPEASTRKMVTQLENWLLWTVIDRSHNVVLFIDEAQSIASRAFPVIRDVINLQTRDRILMQIVMVGQTNVDRRLRNFPALRSRIASASTLHPLSYDECDAMLLHRLEMAGAYDPFKIYSSRAVRAVYEHSNGVPRDFVVVAEAAMKEAFLRDAQRVDLEHVGQALLSLAGRNDYVLDFGETDAAARAPLRSISRAAAGTLQQMAAYAKAV